MFILLLPQDKEAEEEVNDGSVHLLFIFISKTVFILLLPASTSSILKLSFQSHIFFHPKSHNFDPTLCTQYRGHYDLMLNIMVITPLCICHP